VLSGIVTGYDAQVGLGTVTADDGTEYLFHVVEIADGTRSIDTGQPVCFQPLPKFGRFQAAEIRKA
jgi:cold shock CspA family protein